MLPHFPAPVTRAGLSTERALGVQCSHLSYRVYLLQKQGGWGEAGRGPWRTKPLGLGEAGRGAQGRGGAPLEGSGLGWLTVKVGGRGRLSPPSRSGPRSLALQEESTLAGAKSQLLPLVLCHSASAHTRPKSPSLRAICPPSSSQVSLLGKRGSSPHFLNSLALVFNPGSDKSPLCSLCQAPR